MSYIPLVLGLPITGAQLWMPTCANILLGISTLRKGCHPSLGAAISSAQDCQQRVKGYTNCDKSINLNVN
jgi:hypothetical protein